MTDDYHPEIVISKSVLFRIKTAWQSPYPKLYEALGKKTTLPNPNGRFLQATTGANAGSTVEAGLPNITGQYCISPNTASIHNQGQKNVKGAFTAVPTMSDGTEAGSYYKVRTYYDLGIDASRSSAVYGRSTTVQPPAYRVKYYIKALD